MDWFRRYAVWFSQSQWPCLCMSTNRLVLVGYSQADGSRRGHHRGGFYWWWYVSYDFFIGVKSPPQVDIKNTVGESGNICSWRSHLEQRSRQQDSASQQVCVEDVCIHYRKHCTVPAHDCVGWHIAGVAAPCIQATMGEEIHEMGACYCPHRI